MNLLLITTPDQQPYLPRFARLACLTGHKVSVLLRCPDTVAEVETGAFDAIICCNQQFLAKSLNALPDFTPPTTRKALTLDDYQGSLLHTVREKKPVIVLNPPEHLQTVPYGSFIATRFLSKILSPAKWFPQTKFEWSVASEDRISQHFDTFRKADYIAIDIETLRENPELRIACVSFTGYFSRNHSSYSLVIPCTSLYWLVWIRKFCDLAAPKILQGGTYDALYLLRWNCPIRNWLFDTLNLMHSWYSELPKRLDFVGAFAIRRIRYWKDDGKSGNLEDFYRYNAQDGWATLNAFLGLMAECPDWALENYKVEFPLNFPALHCECEGWKIDKEQFQLVRAAAEKAVEEKLAWLRRILRAPDFNPNSPTQVLKLFRLLGCGDLESTDKANMLKAEFRHPLNGRILGIIKEIRKDRKSLSNYLDETKIPGWRVHYRINVAGTDTERSSCSESSYWRGFQIQNVTRGSTIKSILVSDEGWRLAEPDLKQSEAYCVGYSSGERKLLDLLESGRDYHSWHVQEFFGYRYEEIWDEKLGKCKTPEAKELRDDISKRVNHGANYNMTEGVLLDTMGPKNVAKAKIKLRLNPAWTLKECCRYLLSRYHGTYVGIKESYYPWIKNQIEGTKKLVSPTGHTRWFFGEMSVRHNMNSAIAHVSQTLSAAICNSGWYRIWWESVYGKFVSVLRLKALIHDSTPYQYRIGAEWVNEEAKKMLTIPTVVTDIRGVKRTMTIPVGMKAGARRWSEL